MPPLLCSHFCQVYPAQLLTTCQKQYRNLRATAGLIRLAIIVTAIVTTHYVTKLLIPESVFNKSMVEKSSYFNNPDPSYGSIPGQVYNRIATSQRESVFKARASDIERHTALQNTLVSEAECLLAYKLGDIDKGKWFCNPYNLPSGCSIYSFGASNGISFEIELQELSENRCKLYVYDNGTLSSTQYLKLQKHNGEFERMDFFKKDVTYEKIISNNERAERAEVFIFDLKDLEMDILPRLSYSIKACQLILTLHQDALQILRLLHFLSRRGYNLVKPHFNVLQKSTTVTFLHDKCLDRYDAKLITRFLRQDD